MEGFCRICSRSDEFQSFDLSIISQISNVRIDDMIVYCTQQEVCIGDSLPQQICAQCFSALTSAFLFRKLTYHSENEFRQMINCSTMPDQMHHQSQYPTDPALSDIEPEVLIPDEIEDPIVPDVGIKEEELQLDDLQIASILPGLLEDSILPTENTSDDIVLPPGRRKRRSTTYACKECKYMSQHLSNFKRHQRLLSHRAFNKVVTKLPLNVVKHVQRQQKSKTKETPTNSNPNTKKRMKKSNQSQRLSSNRARIIYRCDDCGYQNYISYNFRRHQATWKHTKTSTFHDNPSSNRTWRSALECRDCGIEFSSNIMLQAHRKDSCLKRLIPSDFANVEEVLDFCQNMVVGSVSKKRRKRKVATTDAKGTEAEVESMEAAVVPVKMEPHEDAAMSEQETVENA